VTTDYFALLTEPRRPWLDPELLKTKFLAFSSEAHPDRHHSAGELEKLAVTRRYTELNAAYNCLREPKDRLLHLLQLEGGVKPAALQHVPSETMNLFVEVARICREADAFLTEKNKITSPLLRVPMFKRGAEWTEKLQALQQKLNARRDELTQELKLMNRAWETPHTHRPLERLEELYRHFSFIARWVEQIQERAVQFSF
jgi:DnaJ-domain-containing protein 1